MDEKTRPNHSKAVTQLHVETHVPCEIIHTRTHMSLHLCDSCMSVSVSGTDCCTQTKCKLVIGIRDAP
jgi:hypothetical protein